MRVQKSTRDSGAVSLWCFVRMCLWVSVTALFSMGANFVRSPDALKIVIKCNKDTYFVCKCIKKPLRATAIEAPIFDSCENSGVAVSWFYYRRRITYFAFRLLRAQIKNIYILKFNKFSVLFAFI